MVEVKFSDTSEVISVGGIVGEIFTLLQRRINFTYSLIEEPNRKWGSKLKNGSYNGIVGALESRQVDVGLAELSVTKERYDSGSATIFPIITFHQHFILQV